MLSFGRQIRPYRLTVRTRPFQGCNRGSIPRRATNTMEHKPYGLIFWIHLCVNMLFIFSWLFFSWWLIIIGETLLQLQYKFLKGCILSKAEFKEDISCITYYLHRWNITSDQNAGKNFVRIWLPILVIIISILWQVVFGFRPLFF